MSITSELEKLTAMKDRGDLSPAEFEKAKALLLSGTNPGPGPIAPPAGEDAQALERKQKTRLITAILFTVAAVLAGVSVAINPRPLQIAVLLCWVGASIAGWVSFSRMPAESPGQERSGSQDG